MLISNHVVVVRFWENHRQAIGASLAASLLLLVAADHFTNFPQEIMTPYGFGGNHKIDILVNGDGANAVEKLGLPNRGCAGAARDKLCGVEILSDIGSEFLIKLGDDKAYTILPFLNPWSYRTRKAARTLTRHGPMHRNDIRSTL